MVLRGHYIGTWVAQLLAEHPSLYWNLRSKDSRNVILMCFFDCFTLLSPGFKCYERFIVRQRLVRLIF